MKSFAIVALAAFAFSACSQDNAFDNVAGGEQTMILEAENPGIADPDTSVAELPETPNGLDSLAVTDSLHIPDVEIVEVDDVQTRSVLQTDKAIWAPTDQLGVYDYTGGKHYQYTNATGGYNRQASFTGTALPAGNKFYAYHPYSASTANGKMAFTMPNPQWGRKINGQSSYDQNSDLLLSEQMTASAGGKTTMPSTLKRLSGVLRLVFADKTSNERLNLTQVENITLTGPMGALFAGSGTVDMSTGAIEGTGSGWSNSVRINYSSDNSFALYSQSRSIGCFIGMIPQTLTGSMTATITLLNGVVITKTFTLTKPLRIVANAITLMTINITDDMTPVVNVAENIDLFDTEMSKNVPYSITNPIGSRVPSVGSNKSWLKIGQITSSGVMITMTSNNTGAPRTATLTFSYPGAITKIVTVTQPPVITATINMTSTPIVTIPMIGGQYTINYQVTGDPSGNMTMTIPSEATWIRQGTVTNTSATIDVDRNTLYNSDILAPVYRSAILTFNCPGAESRTVKISQYGMLTTYLEVTDLTQLQEGDDIIMVASYDSTGSYSSLGDEYFVIPTGLMTSGYGAFSSRWTSSEPNWEQGTDPALSIPIDLAEKMRVFGFTMVNDFSYGMGIDPTTFDMIGHFTVSKIVNDIPGQYILQYQNQYLVDSGNGFTTLPATFDISKTNSSSWPAALNYWTPSSNDPQALSASNSTLEMYYAPQSESYVLGFSFAGTPIRFFRAQQTEWRE